MKIVQDDLAVQLRKTLDQLDAGVSALDGDLFSGQAHEAVGSAMSALAEFKVAADAYLRQLEKNPQR